jgi:hypothetical protein
VLGALLVIIGFVALVEMVQSWSQNGSEPVAALVYTADPGRAGHWLLAVALLPSGVLLLRDMRRRLRR